MAERGYCSTHVNAYRIGAYWRHTAGGKVESEGNTHVAVHTCGRIIATNR